MKKQAPNQRPLAFSVTAGAPSVLVVLICLCLTALSVLSLIAAGNEFILASRTVTETERYYQADAEASAILAGILEEYRRTGTVPSIEGVTFACPEGQIAANGEESPAFLAEFDVPCGENSTLRCSAVVYPDGRCDILCWKKVFSAEQTFFDDSMNIWSGE